MRCRALSRTEVRSVAKALRNPRDRFYFLLGVSTGYRVAELVSIRHADFFSDRVVVLASQMKGKKRDRVSKVPRDLLPYIHLATGISRSQFWRSIKAAAARAGIDTSRIGTHTMRKTYAQWLFDSQGNFEIVRIALGHRDAGSTMRYLEDASGSAVGALVDKVEYMRGLDVEQLLFPSPAEDG